MLEHLFQLVFQLMLGFSINIYLKDEYLKVEIGLCKGKKLFNKKEDKKEQDIKRETARMLNI